MKIRHISRVPILSSKEKDFGVVSFVPCLSVTSSGEERWYPFRHSRKGDLWGKKSPKYWVGIFNQGLFLNRMFQSRNFTGKKKGNCLTVSFFWVRKPIKMKKKKKKLPCFYLLSLHDQHVKKPWECFCKYPVIPRTHKNLMMSKRSVYQNILIAVVTNTPLKSFFIRDNIEKQKSVYLV